MIAALTDEEFPSSRYVYTNKICYLEQYTLAQHLKQVLRLTLDLAQSKRSILLTNQVKEYPVAIPEYDVIQEA